MYALLFLLFTIIILYGYSVFMPNVDLRMYGVFITIACMFMGIYAAFMFDFSGSGFQHISSLGPLSFGYDSVGLSLVLLTTGLFPICVGLMRTTSGILTFLLLELVILGSLIVLDLLGFYIMFEASLILLFLLIARFPLGSVDAAYKITLYTMAGSLPMLGSILLLYSMYGTTDLLTLQSLHIPDHIGYMVGWGLFIVFSVKIPLMPVHLWLPEAHVAAPTAGSVLLAGVLLKLGGLGFIRYLIPLFSSFSSWIFPLICTICLCSFLYSSLSTIRQSDLKKIVAYSSIAHMSLITLAIFSMGEYSVYSSTYMMVAHGLVSPGLFLLVGFLYDRYHTKFIHYYSGLVSYMPVYCVFFLLLTCANISFPLSPNFVGEVLCLVSLVSIHPLIPYVFCVCQVLGGVYAFWAYNRVIGGVIQTRAVPSDITRWEFAVLTPLILCILWLGISSI